MPVRQGARAGVGKIRKPQLSAQAKENREKQQQLARATTSAMTSPTSPPPPEIISISSSSPRNMASSSLSPPPASSPSPPPANMLAEIVPTTARIWVGSFKQGTTQIKTLFVKLKNHSKDLTPQNLADRIGAVCSFLRYLEYEVEMTPALRDQESLDRVLAIPELPDYKDTAPPALAAECRRLLDKFNEESWGADDVPDGPAAIEAQPEDDDGPVPSTVGAGAPSATSTDVVHTATFRPPAPDHPIWGLNGIMHCFCLRPDKMAIPVVDPRYTDKKRNAKVYGHNGFEPGAWWPYQKLAHFFGAHGAPVRGITGGDEGAYSIVSSGSSTYDELDHDFGDKLLYSADNSHDNTDPDKITFTSKMSQSLHKSIATGNPVRVLRSSGGKKAYTPKCGIRYDGLYRVNRVLRVHNKRGGLYEQFELIQLPGQRSLAEIQSIPTQEQQDAFNKIKNGYE